MKPQLLGKAGEEAAKTLGNESAIAGLNLLGWLRDKATGRAKEALDDAESKPGEDNQADLHKQLTKLPEARSELVAELRALVPESAADTGGQHMTFGDNSRGVQTKGDHNTITISG